MFDLFNILGILIILAVIGLLCFLIYIKYKRKNGIVTKPLFNLQNKVSSILSKINEIKNKIDNK